MNYSWTLPLSVEAIQWNLAGDEWLHWLSTCAAEQASGLQVSGQKFDDTTRPFIEVSCIDGDGSPSATHLLLLPLEDGLAVYLGGRQDGLDDAIASVWSAVVKCATSRVGQTSEEIEWTAIIGTRGEGRYGGQFALARRIHIGPFELTPGDQALVHMGRSLLAPSLHSASIGYSWPVYVRGSHQGYSWAAAGKGAGFDLRRLCALLSLDRDYHCWTILESPTPLALGERRLPESGHATYSPTPQGPLSGPPDEPSELWEPSSWLADAWDEMARRPWLANAVLMHHEGQVTDEEHPSLALVAYVSSIEAISNRLFDDVRCEKCGAHLNVAARFRETLRLVVPADRADRLAPAYNRRSTSVHQGRLHGSDNAPGMFGLIWNDPEREFDLQIVLGMRTASKELIILALQGRLPARRRFEEEG